MCTGNYWSNWWLVTTHLFPVVCSRRCELPWSHVKAWTAVQVQQKNEDCLAQRLNKCVLTQLRQHDFWSLKLLPHVDMMPWPFLGVNCPFKLWNDESHAAAMKYKTLLAFLQTLRARWVQVLAAKRSTVHPLTRLLLMVCAITGIVILSSYMLIFYFFLNLTSYCLKELFRVCFSVCVQFGWEKRAWRSSDRSQGWWGCSVTSLAGYISV